jgi:hypothetical protein
MEKYNMKNDLKVFGVHVKNFPKGIGLAFDSLLEMIPGGFDRSYYGISSMSETGTVVYKAVAEEKFDGEAQKYNCEQDVISKGEYLTVSLKDWRKKTDSIKDIFHEMMKDDRVDKTKPCIEWYKDDNEMMCMLKMKGTA